MENATACPGASVTMEYSAAGPCVVMSACAAPRGTQPRSARASTSASRGHTAASVPRRVPSATAFCLASIDDLRLVLDLSSRGGHSDAAAAASVTSLSSWMWSAIWLVVGAGACALGLWAALSDDDRTEDLDPTP